MAGQERLPTQQLQHSLSAEAGLRALAPWVRGGGGGWRVEEILTCKRWINGIYLNIKLSFSSCSFMATSLVTSCDDEMMMCVCV